MNRAEKADIVSALAAQMQRTQFLAVADYRKVTVAEVSALRRKFREAGMSYVVIKNTLARKAMEGTPLEVLGPKLKGMNGFIIAEADPIAAARALREISKDLKKAEKFTVWGGYFEGVALDAVAVDKVADLPGKAELLSTLLATIQEPPRQVLGVLQGPARDLLYLLKNYEQKLAEAGA